MAQEISSKAWQGEATTEETKKVICQVKRITRPGNVHSARGWRGVLEPTVAHYGRMGERPCFRADAAFVTPEVCEYLEGPGLLTCHWAGVGSKA